MQNVLVICCGAMSSSMIARKLTRTFVKLGCDIQVEATDLANSDRYMEEGNYDLYLISPQIKMHKDHLVSIANKYHLQIEEIPASMYVPVGKGMNELVEYIESLLTPELPDAALEMT